MHYINITIPPLWLLPFAAIIILTIVSSCSRSQDQIAFEQRAFRTPQNFTEITPAREILHKDEDDWRIGPMFQGQIEVEVPPYPNPTISESVRMELNVTGLGSVDGWLAVAYYDRFDDRSLRTLDESDRSPLEAGIHHITIFPAGFDRYGRYDAAREANNGLHRLFIYDNRFNLITYGDIKLK
ncbi:MAG: hypothetical protein WD272_06310 [Balneolales bacterium]